MIARWTEAVDEHKSSTANSRLAMKVERGRSSFRRRKGTLVKEVVAWIPLDRPLDYRLAWT